MAFESYYWKKDIKRDISYIQNKIKLSIRNLSDSVFDEYFSKIEIKLFLMAFSVRKLIESKKLPDSAKHMELKCIKYKRNLEKQGIISDYEKLYDFDNPIKDKVKILFLLNQFIHSHFFQILPNKKANIEYIFLASDRQKVHCLYSVKIKDFLACMSKVAQMQVTSISARYDPDTGQIETIIK